MLHLCSKFSNQFNILLNNMIEQQSTMNTLDIENIYNDSQLHMIYINGAKCMGLVRVSSERFEFNQYDYGDKDDKKKYNINKKIRKYYTRRNFLFSKFSQGIQIDEQSWYSVVAEPISLNLRDRLLKQGLEFKTVFEPFCGVGGIAIHLSVIAQQYVVNDLDINKIEMLDKNFKVYNNSIENLTVLNNDFLKIQPFSCDLLILCPPWGGIDLEQYSYKPLDSIMFPKLSDILKHSKKFSHNLILQMPKNTNIQNLLKCYHDSGITPILQIQKIIINEQTNQLLIFSGEEKLTKIKLSVIYEKIYAGFKLEDKEAKQSIKVRFKNDPLEVLEHLYGLNKKSKQLN